MRDIIRINHLTFNYNKRPVFIDFNLSIKEGSYISISGANKCGKTTLIKLIAGILPNNGSIILNYSYLDTKDNITPDLGIVLSNMKNSFITNSVYKELCFTLENLKYPPDLIEKRVVEVSKKLKIAHLLESKIDDLTTREKQILLIACALIHKPKILLLDNPFYLLNKEDILLFKKLFLQLKNRDHVTIVFMSNNLEDTLDSDYLYILNQGKIAIEGEPISVMQQEKLLTKLGLELPFLVDLSHKLKFYGLIDDIIIDMESMVNKLWK
ncbi:MAG: energy-coupling factor ABC transporter ATP-binding protein [Bacilli bacterium]